MRTDIAPGAVFPDYELSDHRGKHRALSELQQGDPLVLVLSRGGFWPQGLPTSPRSWHHCQMLPCMSKSPKSFGFSSPTGCVRTPELPMCQP